MDIKELREAQRCFYSDGYMICNFVIRKNGQIIRSLNGCLKFPVAYKKKKEENKNYAVQA